MLVVHTIACLFLLVQYSWAQPVLDTSTHNISLTAGNAAVLTCQVRNLGDQHKVIWMGPSNTVLTYGRERFTTDDRFSVEQPYISDWNLYIRHAKPRDAGTYTCKVDTNPPQTKKVNLNIKVAPTINHDLSSRSPQTVREGQNVTLTCIVTAEPAASVMWVYYNPTNPEAEDKFPASVTGESIVINSITRDQAGIYTCQAFNGIPPISKKNITVDVEFPPSVTTRTSKISQYRGRDTTIDCIIKAYPQEIAVWRKGETEISEDESVWKFVPTLYKRSDSEFVLNLQIFALEPGDFGLYTCEATNMYGTSTTSVLIEEIVTTTTTTTPTPTTTLSTTTEPPTTTTISSSSHSISTTTQKGVIIDDNNNSSHIVEPPYTVLTTPAVKPPDGQGGGPKGGAVSLTYKWMTLTVSILSMLVMI